MKLTAKRSRTDRSFPNSDWTVERTERDTKAVKRPRWVFGAGTPFPSTPCSESTYDGDKLFDDCEPWVL